MPHISAADLFRVIDPLKKPVDIIEFLQRYDLPLELETHLHNHYEFILNGDFLNPAKIERSLRYFSEQGEDIIAAIKQLVDNYGVLDMTRLPSMKLKRDDMFFFWAFETGAFILLNQIIVSEHRNLIWQMQTCFQNGQMYKAVYIRDPKRSEGAKIRGNNYKQIENEMRAAWKSFPESRKNNTQKSCNWLMQNHNPYNLKESTIKAYIRRWRKNNL